MKKFLFTFLAIIILVTGYFWMSKNISMTNTIPANRLTYTGNGFAFQYPKTFGANVWRAKNRPPMLTVVAKDKDPLTLGCDQRDGIPLATKSGKTTDGLSYLFYKRQDAGAGSLYSSYCYVVQGAKKYYVLSLAIQSHIGCEQGNCGAYCETEFEQECRNFDLARDGETPIGKIVNSLKEITTH